MIKKLLIINPEHYMEAPFDQQLTIGRDVYNSLSLRDAEISRSHAIIFDQDSDTIIKDLNSRNGVYVNGDRVKEQVIVDGDEIVLGSTIIFFNPHSSKNLEKGLSPRGEHIFKSRLKRVGAKNVEPITVFPTEQMERTLERLFHNPESTTYFSLSNSMALLKSFYSMAHAIDTADLFHITLERAMEMAGSERGVIMEADDDKKKLKVRALTTRDDTESGIEISQQILRVLLRAERCVYCPDVANDNRFSKAAHGLNPVSAFIAAPIMLGKDYFGFIYLDGSQPSGAYNHVTLRSLYFLTSHLGALLRPRATHFTHHALMTQEAGAAVT